MATVIGWDDKKIVLRNKSFEPYADDSEFLEDYKGNWIRRKKRRHSGLCILAFDELGITVLNYKEPNKGLVKLTYALAFEKFEWLDGTVFGTSR